jgi:foldase protein PrsA
MKKYQAEFKKVDFKSEDGKKILAQIRKDTLDRLVEDRLVADEAKKLKVSLTNKELNDSYADLIKSNGGDKSFAEVLKKYYGLTPEEFKDEIYKSRLLRQKVSDKFSSDDTVNQDAKKKAEEVLAKVKAGEDFATLAKQYSQDSTASNGGDLGYFAKGKMVPEFEKAAFAMKAGEVSGLVKTVYGYHIIKVTDVKGEEIRASHILIKTQDFNAWLDTEKAKAKISDYIHVR